MSLLPDGRMPGMASPANLRLLRNLQGKRAEVPFLRLMAAHHKGGVMMAEVTLQKSDEAPVQELVRAIRAAQTAEITAMSDMLAKRGAMAAQDAR